MDVKSVLISITKNSTLLIVEIMSGCAISDYAYDYYYPFRKNSTQSSSNNDDNESWEVDDEVIE